MGAQLGPLAHSQGCLGFLTAGWLGSNKEHSKREEAARPIYG